MITVKTFIEKLNLRLLTNHEADEEISVQGCYLGDLLLNVMAKAKEGDVWITVMTNPNVVAVAQLINLPAVIILEGHQPMPMTLEKANIEHIPVFSSEESAYEMAVSFHQSHFTEQKASL